MNNCTLCEKPINSTHTTWRGQKYHPKCAVEAINTFKAKKDVVPAREHNLPDNYAQQIEESLETDEFFEDEIDVENIPDVDDDILNQIPAEKGNGHESHGTMVIHAGAHRIERADLYQLELPEATDTFQPIAHSKLIEAVEESLTYRNLSIVREEYAVSKDGMKMFALLEINSGMQGIGFAIGLRNANNKSMRLGMVAGYRVFICDNMALSGEFKPMLAKHTKNFDLIESVSIGVDRVQRNFLPLKQQIGVMKNITLKTNEAKQFIYDSFTEHKLPVSLFKEVHNNYFDSPIPEFRDFNVWALTNAYTSAFKKLQPISQFEQSAKVGKLINERFLPV